MRSFKTLMIIATLFLAFSIFAAAEEAWFMRSPDIHKDKIVFSLAGDLWITDLNGSIARQITSGEGDEMFPRFSPDGKEIAYTGQYNGYFFVYVIPAEGGTPKQLTSYPSFSSRGHWVLDWTPDGKYVVYGSNITDAPDGRVRLFKINKDGGWPEALPLSEAATMSFSPDGTKIAFNRTTREFRTWKRYQGGMQQDIWLYDMKADKVEKLIGWEGTDRWPMWIGNKIYYLSDQTGKLNFFCYDVDTKNTKQVTDFKEWDARWPAAGPDSIIFEQQGKLFKLNLSDEKVSEVKVNIAYDKSQLLPTYINAAPYADSYSLANGGKRIAVTARGELFTIPADKGDVRNLSETPGAREVNAEWSPDSKWISYISDETGIEELYLVDQYGKNKKQLTKDSKSIITGYTWSPDSKKIAFGDLTGRLAYVDGDSGEITEIEVNKGGPVQGFSWSPKSDWIVYGRYEPDCNPSIAFYNLKTKEITQVTDETNAEFSFRFDPSGNYLYFISTRDYNPLFDAFDFTYFYTRNDRVFVLPLREDVKYPFLPESDEVEVKDTKPAPPAPKKDDDDEDKDEKKAEKKDEGLKIDLVNAKNRIIGLPMDLGSLFNLQAGNGMVFYLKMTSPMTISLAGFTGTINLCVFDMKSKKETVILPNARGYALSPDGKNILWTTFTHYGISPASPAPIQVQTGKPLAGLKLETLKVPLEEWRQMFMEAWRGEKYNFYVPNMHGLDWDAIKVKYGQLLPHLNSRMDLTYLIGEMIGELNTSHTYVGGGDVPRVLNIQTGLLGCDFELTKDGYYKIQKIFKGENWMPNGRSPLTEPYVKANEGDYILAINGKALKYPESPYQLLEKTLGKIVTLKLNSKPIDKGAWTTEVKPIASESHVRYLDWVEQNRLKVEKATNGKVGYVHVPDMMLDGLNQFVKQWFPQINKEGIIVDGRFNGGGFVSSAILERMSRVPKGMDSDRFRGSTPYPAQSFAGHLVMLTNKNAGSDGDNFAYYFKLLGLGPVIGTRTWGGVVGIYGFTGLMDGGFYSVPTSTKYGRDGKWIIEGHGVDPDIVVDNMPNDEFKGKDDQLEKAIELIMKKIKEEPRKLPEQPADPVKTP
ncbi:MAG: PD40 domain-containing protein [Acidobacteria bacterium]|nr:PD40 domain-containing protein [Acidobacteriota bacterium]